MRTDWDVRTAARNLGITFQPFDMAYDKDSRGYSDPERRIAVHPQERYPVMVTLHEMAHIELGHTTPPFGKPGQITFLDMMYKDINQPLFEAEAHMVALEAAFMLGFESGIDINVAEEISYLDHWRSQVGNPSDERVKQLRDVAKRIVAAGSR